MFRTLAPLAALAMLATPALAQNNMAAPATTKKVVTHKVTRAPAAKKTATKVTHTTTTTKKTN